MTAACGSHSKAASTCHHAPFAEGRVATAGLLVEGVARVDGMDEFFSFQKFLKVLYIQDDH